MPVLSEKTGCSHTTKVDMLPGDICIGELGPSQDTAAGGSTSARDRRVEALPINPHFTTDNML